MSKDIYEEMRLEFEPDDGLSELESELESLAFEENTEYDNIIARRISLSIRKAFIKAGIITGIAAVVLTLAIVFALPKAVNQFYYNPAKIVAQNGDEEVCQLQKDINIYAEAVLPELGPDIQANVESRGYGNYGFYVMSSFNTDGSGDRSYHNGYSGSINRNYGQWYDPDVLTPPSTDNDETFVQNAVTSRKGINSLGDNEEYYAYVTFRNDMSYDEMLAWFNSNLDKYNLDNSYVWCAVESCSGQRLNYGFRMYDANEGCIESAAKAKRHFLSLMDYLADNEKFVGVVDGVQDTTTYKRSAAYVRKHGLDIYGIMIVSDKKNIRKIADDSSVQNVTTAEML